MWPNIRIKIKENVNPIYEDEDDLLGPITSCNLNMEKHTNNVK
jgi:hypothetical protein